MSAKLSAGLLVALGLSFTTSIASAKRAVYAIAIGNNQPSAADTALLSVLDEATQRRHSGLASRTTLPSLAQLRDVLRQYRRELNQFAFRGEKPALYISFSGHGSLLSSGDYGLSFLDGELTKRMLFEEILTQFGDVQVHLIIDACHAAGVVGLKGPFGNESDASTTEIADVTRDDFLGKRSLERFPNVGVIVAASATETSHEWSRIESGVFSYEILSGLYGAADVNGDHRIEYSELLAFVSAANRGLPPGAAKPRIISVAPAANLRTTLVDLMELRGSILLAGVPHDLGHFHIETSKGQRLLDAHIERSQSVLLALPSTEGELYLRDAHRKAKLPILPRIELAKLTFTSQGDQARGSVDGALQEGLLSTAFYQRESKPRPIPFFGMASLRDGRYLGGSGSHLDYARSCGTRQAP